MKNIDKIYMIKSHPWESFGHDNMIFDSKQKAKDFLNRFKTKQNLEIVEVSLNPTYLIDKEQDPYHLYFWGSSNIPEDIALCRKAEEVEDALIENCTFEGVNLNIKRIGASVYLFASDRDEAIRRGLEIRDKAIADMSSKFDKLKSKTARSKKL